MNKVLRLGFHTSISVFRFAVYPRKPVAGPGSFVHMRPIAMGSKRRVTSNSSDTLALIVDENKKKKPKVAEDIEAMGVAEDGQGIQYDPKKIEEMTIQELRTSLKRVGIPAKGRKQDLASAFRSYMVNNAVGGCHEVLKDESSEHSKCISIKGVTESEGDCVEASVSVDEFSYLEHSKKTEKQSAVKKIGGDAAKVVKKQKLSTKSMSKRTKTEKNLSSSRKEVSLTVSHEVRSDGDISLSLNQSEPWTVLAHKKPQEGWIPYNPKTLRPPPLPEGTKHVKLMSWNVNGLRALLKLESFSALQLAQRENFDVLCLQETKLQVKDVEAIKQTLIDGYDHSFWSCSVSKLGYSGTAIISRIKPLSVRYGIGTSDLDHDIEGRVVTVEFDSFYLISAYVPNSGDGLRRLPYRIEEWDPSLSNYVKELEKSKPVILTGDLNCAHEEIDIYNPSGNKRSAGFTNEERQSFGANFLAKGLVDTFRKQHPDAVGYTYWGYRHGGRKTNKGWRLDYFLVSESIADKVHDSYILPDINGSDHCPLGLILKL